ncbi:uncharacterized protein Z520_04355 [Fonsecaea multimorphosa CBS 102226]|uniref:F-box domain-containing protein n=1 Tax=Fonsecaea multimorphosa CBS 102226 TaxID=1442371 RepID=A0A0D2K930_9EURO|nr:uncharacterized protein Z520_04355 [Fonsecaea multimorphosa CBS 102226]KIX99719.1 hypothetical protein Z520_04355 [Fonsecaea multimorphosa CBS 102226]OAL26767.1 hypothetical protein AYO22_04120 [Fonsecaea multimorphosa]
MEAPTLVKNKDPFNAIPRECSKLVLDCLALSDIGRSAMVSKSWNQIVTSWISSYGIAAHFPCAENPRMRGVCDAIVLHEFERLARQDRALRNGEATSARRFPNATLFVTAGDFAAWASDQGTVIYYQRLQEGAETMTLDLTSLGESYQQTTVRGMLLNSDGFLLVKISLRLAPFFPYYGFPMWYRNFVYSLRDRAIFWEMNTEVLDEFFPWAEYTPLCIGKDRVYLSQQTLNNSYNLVAEDFRSGTRLHRTPIVASIEDDDQGSMAQRTLELIRLGNDELIIQFDSKRLLGRPKTMEVNSFAIINGADGRIQTIACSGFRRCARAFANTSSNSIALVGSSVNSSGQMIVQKFSQQPDKIFLRTAVHVVSLTLPTNIFRLAMHPFTFHAFSFQNGDSSPRALILTAEKDLQTCSGMDTLVARCGPGVVVDAYRCIVSNQLLTLRPQEPDGHDRRTFELRGDSEWRDIWAFDLLDDEQLVLGHYGHSGSGFRGRQDTDHYLFSFTPKAYRSEAEGE